MGHSKGSPEREVHSNTGLPNKDRISQINNLTQHLQELEEQQQTKPRVSRRKEITKIRAELTDIETERTIQRINNSRSWFFEKTNKIDKPLSGLIKKKRETIQINTIKNERVEITIDITEIQKIIRNYYKQLYAQKFEDPGKMGKFLETYNSPKLSQERAESLITAIEIEAVIKNDSQHTKALDGMASYKVFTKHLRKS